MKNYTVRTVIQVNVNSMVLFYSYTTEKEKKRIFRNLTICKGISLYLHICRVRTKPVWVFKTYISTIKPRSRVLTSNSYQLLPGCFPEKKCGWNSFIGSNLRRGMHSKKLDRCALAKALEIKPKRTDVGGKPSTKNHNYLNKRH